MATLVKKDVEICPHCFRPKEDNEVSNWQGYVCGKCKNLFAVMLSKIKMGFVTCPYCSTKHRYGETLDFGDVPYSKHELMKG